MSVLRAHAVFSNKILEVTNAMQTPHTHIYCILMNESHVKRPEILQILLLDTKRFEDVECQGLMILDYDIVAYFSLL